MIFWRKKKNGKEQEAEALDDELMHPAGEPALELPTEYEPELDDAAQHELSDPVELNEIEPGVTPEAEPEAEEQQAEDDGAPEGSEENSEEQEGGWFSRLAGGLSKSSNKITQGLTDLVTKKKLDQDTLDELEEVLISADLGPKTAMAVIEDFSKDRFGKDLSEEESKVALAESIAKILTPVAQPLTVTKPDNGPYVILVCGVNGAGKTTTIGKIAHQLHFDQGLKVTIAAGDTFRAAATEQLEVWARRVNASFVAKDIGADAAAVAYEAYETAKEQGADVLLVDTAGRLQNKTNLMEELQKIIRVLKKSNENLPHATLLVLDSTTGQNAFSQVEIFKDMVNVSGLIVTKLDGSAKGGVLVGLADQFGVPVHAIGVGEAVEDLQAFDAQSYARSLMGLDIEG
jgi:fused signal recognition particle receptor